ncbi:hypothetical protein [Actinoplanes sp. L3-i22]|uniref:hypothetical protein n=1 Tax=Actinoplanes sp. L3-i22 TaxID=2836373 RepID=UPI001C851A09|nr:hypothetical protein [Actinoplanes sp. L3-i22]
MTVAHGTKSPPTMLVKPSSPRTSPIAPLMARPSLPAEKFGRIFLTAPLQALATPPIMAPPAPAISHWFQLTWPTLRLPSAVWMPMAAPSSAISWAASSIASWTTSPPYRIACSFLVIGGFAEGVGVSLGFGVGASLGRGCGVGSAAGGSFGVGVGVSLGVGVGVSLGVGFGVVCGTSLGVVFGSALGIFGSGGMCSLDSARPACRSLRPWISARTTPPPDAMWNGTR